MQGGKWIARERNEIETERRYREPDDIEAPVKRDHCPQTMADVARIDKKYLPILALIIRR